MSTNSRFPHQPVFKPKGRRVTYLQVDALFDYLIAHPEVASGYSNSTAGRYRSQKAWETAAGILNRVPGGARKDAKAWSAFWSNYKNKLKRRVRIVHAARKNGQPPTTRLTELDIKVLPILGPLFGCGDLPSDTEENVIENEVKFAAVKSPPPEAASPAPSSPDTLPSPPRADAPPLPAAAARSKRRLARPTRRASPAANGASDSDSDRSLRAADLTRLYAHAEDKTAAALLRVAAAVDALAHAAQAQAAAARLTAEGMEMIARAVTEAFSKRDGPTD